MDLWHLYLVTAGRISRKPFWIGTLVLAVAMIGLMFLIGDMMGIPLTEDSRPEDDAKVSLVIELLLLYPSLAIAIKRLHDLDLSAWWTVPLFGLGFLGLAVELSGRAETAEGTTMLGHMVLGLYILTFAAYVVLGVAKGTEGANRYGPNPLDAPADAAM